jgi:ATP-dependent DNA helicase RecG
MIGRFGADSEELKFQEPLEGNLVYLLDEVQNMLNYKFLIRPVDFEGMHRREGDEYPVAALREMLLNALVHKKYMGATIQIRVFDNKLSIWNEGTLPTGMTIESLKAEHNSKSPNPVIADACFKAGYIDTWGRGTLKIFKACKDAGLPEPQIIEKDGGIEVTLFKTLTKRTDSEPTKNPSEEIRDHFGTISERIRDQFGTKVEATFRVIYQNPEYTAETIAKELDVTSRTVENHQAKLKDAGYIERRGDNVGGYWKVL